MWDLMGPACPEGVRVNTFEALAGPPFPLCVIGTLAPQHPHVCVFQIWKGSRRASGTWFPSCIPWNPEPQPHPQLQPELFGFSNGLKYQGSMEQLA